MAILTISRQFGSGGRDVCYRVAEELGYQFLDKEKIVAELAKTGPHWAQWGSNLDEHSPSTWERFDWSFKAFGALIKSLMLQYALKDNVVLMGRGANFIIQDVPHSFRIRVIASLEKRIQTIMIREDVDYQTAAWLTNKTDEDRRRFLLIMYGKDWDDPSHYDAVFDSGKQTIEEIVRVCCETLRDRDALKTDLAEKTVRMRAAAAHVEAGLLLDPALFLLNIETLVEDDHLVVQGTVRNPQHKKKVEERARQLGEGHNMLFRLHYRV